MSECKFKCSLHRLPLTTERMKWVLNETPRKNIVNMIKVQERIWEIIIKWTNCDIAKCQLIRKEKIWIYVSLINVLESTSGSRGAKECMYRGWTGVRPPPTTPVAKQSTKSLELYRSTCTQIHNWNLCIWVCAGVLLLATYTVQVEMGYLNISKVQIIDIWLILMYRMHLVMYGTYNNLYVLLYD